MNHLIKDLLKNIESLYHQIDNERFKTKHNCWADFVIDELRKKSFSPIEKNNLRNVIESLEFIERNI